MAAHEWTGRDAHGDHGLMRATTSGTANRAQFLPVPVGTRTITLNATGGELKWAYFATPEDDITEHNYEVIASTGAKFISVVGLDGIYVAAGGTSVAFVAERDGEAP